MSIKFRPCVHAHVFIFLSEWLFAQILLSFLSFLVYSSFSIHSQALLIFFMIKSPSFRSPLAGQQGRSPVYGQCWPSDIHSPLLLSSPQSTNQDTVIDAIWTINQWSVNKLPLNTFRLLSSRLLIYKHQLGWPDFSYRTYFHTWLFHGWCNPPLSALMRRWWLSYTIVDAYYIMILYI